MTISYIKVMAFIDWNSQLRLSKIEIKKYPLSAAEHAFKTITKKIITKLDKINPNSLFKINLRFYHGWHKGYEETINSKAIRSVIAKTDFSTLSTKINIVFDAEIGYGSCLLSALTSRMHEKQAIHLPNTLRNKLEGQGVEEKMVDTALATDILVTAYAEPATWIIAASEDDDLVPSLFSAEAAIHRSGSRILLLSERKRSQNFLKLDDICV